MTSFSTRKTRPSACSAHRTGFSLAEIAIAMGIVSFVLVALMGLMSVGLNEARHGREDTMLAAMSETALSQVTAPGYAGITNGTAYFSYDGIPTNSAAAYYVCRVDRKAPALRPDLAARAAQVTLTFHWPYLTAQPDRTNYPNEQIFTTTVAEF